MGNPSTLKIQLKNRPRQITQFPKRDIQQQRKLTKAIKRARIVSLLPFVASNENNNK